MADRSGPFDDLEELFDRLTRQLESAARSWELEADRAADEGRTPGRSIRQSVSLTSAATSLDLADEGDEFVVTVDVPGYETDDLEIRLSGRTLSIRGEREREAERGDTAAQYIRREREVQSFNRQLRIPESIDEDDVSATVNNGILTIRLPKRNPSDEAMSIDID